MGGCRCIFRKCTVSTARNPRMHFFRFPVKDAQRLQKWVQMADVDFILKLPVPQQKNKVVCARHFRDECFMNYMKDSLVANAVPTLDRMKNGYALDYESGPKPKLIPLPKPTQPHLIPPAGFQCPLDLDDDNTEFVGEVSDEQITNEVTTNQDVVVLSLDDAEILDLLEPIPEKPKQNVARRKRPNSMTTQDFFKKPKILNTQAPTNLPQGNSEDIITSYSFIRKNDTEILDLGEAMDENFLVCNENSNTETNYFKVIEGMDENSEISEDTSEEIENASPVKEFEDKAIQADEAKEFKDIISKRQYELKCQEYEMKLQKEVKKNAAFQKDIAKQIEQLEEDLQAAHRQIEVHKQEYDQLKIDNTQLSSKIKSLQTENSGFKVKTETLSLSNNLLRSRLDDLTSQHADMVENNKQLEAKYQALEQQQVSTVSTSRAVASQQNVGSATTPSSVVPAQAPQLSKAQLFNGIKKYLSSSMVALVRMEMFGGAERQWKPDEKQASLDLLRLGENVYRYFTDEWRFRLPGLRQVTDWLNEAAVTPEDDEDL